MSQDKGRDIRGIEARVAAGTHDLADVKKLIEFVRYYRKRVHDVQIANNRVIGELARTVADFRFAHMLAREEIDPEREGTYFSSVDVAAAAADAQACARIRARVVAERARWKKAAP